MTTYGRNALAAQFYSDSGIGYDSAVSTLNRYVLREIGTSFLLSVGLFTLILLLARILRLVESVVNKGVPVTKLLSMLAYILPGFLELTIPMALLLATIIALGRLSADSEIIALRAAGLSVYQIGRPALCFALAAVVVCLALSTYLRPLTSILLREELYEIAKVRATAAIQPRVFSDDFTDFVIFVDEIVPPGNTLRGILISGNLDQLDGSTDDTTDSKSTLIAEEGIIIPDEATQVVSIRLFNGSLHVLTPESGEYQQTQFSSFDLNLDLGTTLRQARDSPREPHEMSFEELTQRLAGEAQSTLPEAIELHRRIALPFACLSLTMLGIAFGIQPARSVRVRGLLLSLAAILSYYLLLTLGESLAMRGYVWAPLGLWLPNVVTGGLGAHLVSRAA